MNILMSIQNDYDECNAISEHNEHLNDPDDGTVGYGSDMT